MTDQSAPLASSDDDVANPADSRIRVDNQMDQVEGGPNLDTILRIPVVVQVVLGSASMAVANLLKLGRGAVIPLDRRIGEPVEITVNGRVVARGEVVVVED